MDTNVSKSVRIKIMEITIRKATPKDFESIQALNKALFDYETRFNDEYNLEWTYSEIGEKYFAHRLESTNTIAFVAEQNQETIGYILAFINTYPFRKNNPIAEIENMFIKDEKRKQGVGSKLMQAVKKEALRRGVKRLKVEAVAQNTNAINFYKKCGFTEFDLILEMNVEE
jgi:ribosomal protein S18 acetylase RimI-like enzyme